MRRFWRRIRGRGQLGTVAHQRAYDDWAACYAPQAHNPLMELEEAAVFNLLPDVLAKRTLDLACGSGRYAQHLRASGASTVLGMDLNQAMLLRGEVKAGVRASMEAIPLANASVDVVVCGLAVGHLPALDKVYGEISRVLASGGVALLSDFHPFQALSGAQRTYRGVDGRLHVVEHYVHLYSDHQAAATSAGLRIEAMAEPRLSDAQAMPVVLVLRMRKVAQSRPANRI